MSSAMTDVPKSIDRNDAAERIKEPFIQTLARAGYVSKGIVYLIVGFLAAEAALGSGGQLGGSKEGIATVLAESPFGSVLVGLLGAGLLAFAAWNVIRAIFNNDHAPKNAKGYLKRAGFVITAMIYIGLGAWALHAGVVGGADASDRTSEWVGKALALPGGAIIAAGIGAFIAGYGVVQVVKSFRAGACERLDLSRLKGKLRPLVGRLCRFGIGARGVVAVIFESFIVKAGWTANKNHAVGPGEVLQSFLGWDYGWAVLAVVAVGLMAYGVYMLCKAAFKPIDATPAT